MQKDLPLVDFKERMEDFKKSVWSTICIAYTRPQLPSHSLNATHPRAWAHIAKQTKRLGSGSLTSKHQPCTGDDSKPSINCFPSGKSQHANPSTWKAGNVCRSSAHQVRIRSFMHSQGRFLWPAAPWNAINQCCPSHSVTGPSVLKC